MEKDQDVSRRDFLKTAAAVAAASALPSGGAPAILASPSPNSVVNYAMIGTGTEGCTLLKFLATIPPTVKFGSVLGARRVLLRLLLGNLAQQFVVLRLLVERVANLRLPVEFDQQIAALNAA